MNSNVHNPIEPRRIRAVFRAVALLLIVIALLVIIATYYYLSERYANKLRLDGELRSNFFAASIISNLQRNSVVPLLIARDKGLSSDLLSGNFQRSSEDLKKLKEELNVFSLTLMSPTGKVVASSEDEEIGLSYSNETFFNDSLSTTETVFVENYERFGPSKFYFTRQIIQDEVRLGVVAVTINLTPLEEIWNRANIDIIVTDTENRVILSSRPYWRGRKLKEFKNDPKEPIYALIGQNAPYIELDQQKFVQSETRIAFRGWRLNYLSSYNSVSRQVNAVIAVEVLVLALLVALGLLKLSRSREKASQKYQRESEELRALNTRLASEIEERQRMQLNLQVAEQSLAQTSKLAALGEMSAAVSHELSQPLTAMTTYLAGAKLLLKRNRNEEALSSLQRIDSLTDRMARITKQLKSYSRKSSEDFRPVDMHETLQSSIAIMSPQFGLMSVEIIKNLTDETVIAFGDGLRIEQIIINLLRNAVDAMKAIDDRQLIINLWQSEMIHVQVIDKGAGIDNKDKLFEPFYTTKNAGEGVGLGLAISATFAKEMGGSLQARDNYPTGAIFELSLPRFTKKSEAAE